MTARKNTARLRSANEKVKRAADELLRNLAHPGRPPKYCEAFCYLAEKISAIGSTNAELAEIFGVVESTISSWIASFPAFNSAIARGRARADNEVERALFHRAKGYSHSAEEIFTAKGVVLRAAYLQHYPPDTGAIVFWLKNRRPNQWRNRVDAPGPAPEDAARFLREQIANLDETTRG